MFYSNQVLMNVKNPFKQIPYETRHFQNDYFHQGHPQAIVDTTSIFYTVKSCEYSGGFFNEWQSCVSISE